ncbi:MAG: nuclear transport factor 2 family protein [Vulcanimicrobiaceae bacterium]
MKTCCSSRSPPGRSRRSGPSCPTTPRKRVLELTRGPRSATTRPTPADVETVRRLYRAVAARDFATAEACFAPDAIWHLPGRSPIAGEHRGRQSIRDGVFAKLARLSGGTFRADLLDVAVGEHYLIALQHATAGHRGRRLDVTACQLIRVEQGQIVEMHGHYSDQYALDDFWQPE